MASPGEGGAGIEAGAAGAAASGAGTDAAACSTPSPGWPEAGTGTGTKIKIGTKTGTPQATAHGGRIIAARSMFPDAPSPWIDLSTGISPFAYPFAAPPIEAFTRLPEPEQDAALRRIAAMAYGAPDADHVCPAPGSQMLISLLPVLLGCRRAAILSPGYAEHEAGWMRAGAEIRRVGSQQALLEAAGPDTALVLCNPNNPDGRRTDAAMLLALAERCDRLGGWLVVDEAYADLEPAPVRAATLLPFAERLVVLRSFGKGYGLAGLRLGFLVGPRPVAAAMAALMGPWPVSGPALSIGTQALADAGWRERTAGRVLDAAARLDAALSGAGLQVVGGTALFRLGRHDQADRLWRYLAQDGLLARRFEDQPGWLRFGLPRDEDGWRRLQAALSRPPV